MSFTITRGCGFRYKLASGYTVSVQFGGGNYCTNYSQSIVTRHTKDASSPNAEVAVIDPRGNLVMGWPHCADNDTVMGYLSPDQVLDVLVWAQKRPPIDWRE